MSNGDTGSDRGWRGSWGWSRSPSTPPTPSSTPSTPSSAPPTTGSEDRPSAPPSDPPTGTPTGTPPGPASERPTEPPPQRPERTELPTDPPTGDPVIAAPSSQGEPEEAAPSDPDAALAGDPDEAHSQPPPPAAAPDEEPLPPRPLPRVVALANQKGGVGKTTTTINLGAALAEDDHRVLIIDLDPQGNATTGLGINSRALDHSIYDVLLAEVPLEDCVESTDVRNLFIAPASLDLAGAEIELVPVMSRETRLRNAIDRVRDDYDYVLIDCPPSLGLLTVNALAAADEVMVPIQCEYYALEGLGQLIRNINLVQRNLNTSLALSSIILVMYDGRTKLAEQVSTEVREHFGNLVCRTVIPRNIRLSEAPSYGQPITTFDPSSRGAVAYRELAREVHRVST